jgi:hypothetical protein
LAVKISDGFSVCGEPMSTPALRGILREAITSRTDAAVRAAVLESVRRWRP